MEDTPPSGSVGPKPRSSARWLRLVGLPAIAACAIVGAIVLLRTPDDTNLGAVVTEDAGNAGAIEGEPAPDFTLQAIDGATYRLSELRGRPVVLNFWATWCGPCRDEMPAIEAEYMARSDSGLIVLAVNVKEGPNTVSGFVRRLELTLPVALDQNGRVSRRYRVQGLPTTVFIRPDGIVDGMRSGAYTRRLFSQRLDQFLEHDAR